MEKSAGIKIHKPKSGLMKNSIRILAIVCIVILIAFFSNYIIIRRWYRNELVQARQDFFSEIFSTVTDTEADIVKISNSVNSNSTITSYIHADVLGGRWNKLQDVEQFAANLMKLDDCIMAVSIYNESDELIAMEGTKFAALINGMESGDIVFISDRVQIEAESEYFFQVIVPAYEKVSNGSFIRIGSVAILYNTMGFKEILNFAASAYSWEDNYVAILDRDGEILTSSGNAAVWDSYMECKEKEKEYLYFQDVLPESEWSLVYVAKQNSFMYHMNQVQIINMLTYIVIIAALIYLCYMMYHKVIKPIKKQLAFVAGYTQDTSKRIEVWNESEFGELEKETNEMLDGIEKLNQKIIEEQEYRLQLEYSKKQTEILAYKNQINPHFMHNTLECIRGMALYHGEKEIAKITEAMSRMFQYNVRGEEIVTIKEMLHSIQDYAVLIEYRFMGKITVETCSTQTVQDFTLPKMIIQPLVENAVQHGVEPKIEQGTVTLTISEMGEKMRIEVRDDGVGMDEETIICQRQKFMELSEENIGGREIGIRNVAQRLSLFYGADFHVDIQSEKGSGTAFVLLLPGNVPESVKEV